MEISGSVVQTLGSDSPRGTLLSMANLFDLARQTDELIKQGNSTEATRLLAQLGEMDLPRESVVLVASLFRRTFDPEKGIKLLNPIVRPPTRSPVKATEEEKAEYASCLARFGAPEEGLEILNKIDATAHPQVLLFQSVALAHQWDYEKSIPLLARYLDSPLVDDYQKLVARMNLAAAYAHERQYANTETTLQEIVEQAERESRLLILANALHVRAAVAVLRGQYSEARKRLKKAEEILRKNQTLDEVLLRKWWAILGLMEVGPSSQTIEAIRAVRAEALGLKHWETVRDCDRFEAFATKDKSLLLHLYFGTPFDSFRKWLLLGAGGEVDIPPSYDWEIGGRARAKHTLDLRDAISAKGAPKLPPGSTLHRLLVTLCSDFYAPVRLATLHHRLHPEEFYNPESSPVRVHKSLNRLRGWCGSAKISVRIVEERGFYRLESEPGVTVRVYRGRAPSGRKEALLEKVSQHWKGEFFTLPEVASFLGVSNRSAARVLDEAKHKGTIEKVGQGRASRFRLKA